MPLWSLFPSTGKQSCHQIKHAAIAPARPLRTGRTGHPAATWHQGEARIYVDGKPHGSGPVDVPESVGDFRIGDREWSTPRPGGRTTLIDEVRIYRRALTPGEVGRIYESAAPGAPDDYQPPRVTLRPCTTPPSIGGRIEPGE